MKAISLDHVDELNQIRDELQVIWCALTNPSHAEECVIPIAEHVNGLRNRIVLICSAIQHDRALRVGEVRK